MSSKVNRLAVSGGAGADAREIGFSKPAACTGTLCNGLTSLQPFYAAKHPHESTVKGIASVAFDSGSSVRTTRLAAASVPKVRKYSSVFAES